MPRGSPDQAMRPEQQQQGEVLGEATEQAEFARWVARGWQDWGSQDARGWQQTGWPPTAQGAADRAASRGLLLCSKLVELEI